MDINTTPETEQATSLSAGRAAAEADVYDRVRSSYFGKQQKVHVKNPDGSMAIFLPDEMKLTENAEEAANDENAILVTAKGEKIEPDEKVFGEPKPRDLLLPDDSFNYYPKQKEEPIPEIEEEPPVYPTKTPIELHPEFFSRQGRANLKSRFEGVTPEDCAVLDAAPYIDPRQMKKSTAFFGGWFGFDHFALKQPVLGCLQLFLTLAGLLLLLLPFFGIGTPVMQAAGVCLVILSILGWMAAARSVFSRTRSYNDFLAELTLQVIEESKQEQ